MAAISGLDAILQWALLLRARNSAPGLIAVSLLLVAIPWIRIMSGGFMPPLHGAAVSSAQVLSLIRRQRGTTVHTTGHGSKEINYMCAPEKRYNPSLLRHASQFNSFLITLRVRKMQAII